MGRCFDGLPGCRSQTQKQRSYEQFLPICMPDGDTLLRLRCGIEWG